MPAAPSLLIVPYRSKTGRLYSQIPVPVAPATTGAGDFTVTRNTTATRFNSAGLLESVASGIPRLDYYTSGGTAGCPALLVEPAATNSLWQSTDSASGWTLNNSMTSATIDVIGVSGVNLTVGASGTIGGGASNYAGPVASPVISLVSGSTYTVSFFTKRTTAHTFVSYYMTFAGAASGSIGSGFDVSGSFSSGSMGGVYNTAGVTNRIRRIERWGTDVFRCSETFTMTASGTVGRINIAIPTGASSQISAPTGTTIGFAAPQLELGSVPTSFIPTTAGTGSRSADVVSVSGAVSGAIGQTEGTIYWEGAINRLDRVFFTLASGNSTTQYVRLQTTGAGLIQGVVTSGTIQCIINTSGVVTLGQFYKVAFAYKENDFVLYLNGALQNTDTSGTLPTNLNSVFFLNSNGTEITDQRIRAAALYTTRLTNAELATLTTL